MIFSQAEIDILRLCAWCKDLPLAYNAHLPAETLSILLHFSLIRQTRQKRSLRITPKGLDLLQVAGYTYPRDTQYRTDISIIKRRLEMAEISAFLWHYGVDVFRDVPDAEKGSTAFLPAFALRRKATANVLGGAVLSGFWYTPHITFVPYYVSSNNSGLYTDMEQRIFSAENLVCGRQPFVVYTGSGDYGEVWQAISNSCLQKQKTTTDSYFKAMERFSCPVTICSLDEDGFRQLRLLSVPDYRDSVCRLVLGRDYCSADSDHVDGIDRRTGQKMIIGFDGNVYRFIRQAAVAPDGLHVMVLDFQFDAVKQALGGRNVMLHTVSLSTAEDMLSVSHTLPQMQDRAFVTEKGESVRVPPIR